MTEFQVITCLATGLGIVATVLNLVAFVREKDRSHVRAGFLVLFALIALVGLLLLPRYAPYTARRLTSRLPGTCQPYVALWLASPSDEPSPKGQPEPTSSTPAPSPLTGSFDIQIRRNLFGGIAALMAKFSLVNLSPREARVTSFRIRITEKAGGEARSYERVLPKPMIVSANGNAETEVELNTEVRDSWLAWHNVEASKRGPIEVRWDCQDADGNRFTVVSTNG